MSANYNPQAFPCLDSSGGGLYMRDTGMTLRDYFAGQALPAVIAATSAGQHMPTRQDGDTHIRQAIARDAYLMADAMMQERAK